MGGVGAARILRVGAKRPLADAIHITQCSVVGREDGGEGWLDTRRLCADFYVHIPIQDNRGAEQTSSETAEQTPSGTAEQTSSGTAEQTSSGTAEQTPSGTAER